MKFYILDENKLKFICMCKNKRIYEKVHYIKVCRHNLVILFTSFSYNTPFFLVYNFVK